MRPLEELVRPNIRALKPYSTARDEFSGGEITTWLDANENPYDNGVNRYPDPHQKLLKQKIAALKGVREEQVFIGNGSDEAIDLCYRIFCRPGVDNAVSIAPTYGMYRVAADVNDVEMREVPLGADYALPVEPVLRPEFAADFDVAVDRVAGRLLRDVVAVETVKDDCLGLVLFGEARATGSISTSRRWIWRRRMPISRRSATRWRESRSFRSIPCTRSIR